MEAYGVSGSRGSTGSRWAHAEWWEAVAEVGYKGLYGCPGGPGLVLDAALGSADFFSRWGSWLSIVTVITGRQACIVYTVDFLIMHSLGTGSSLMQYEIQSNLS